MLCTSTMGQGAAQQLLGTIRSWTDWPYSRGLEKSEATMMKNYVCWELSVIKVTPARQGSISSITLAVAVAHHSAVMEHYAELHSCVVQQ